MEMIEIPKQEYEAMKELIVALMAEVTALKAEIVELKARLNKNSNNSSKPPSSDGLKKGDIKNNRTPNGRTSGGQRGHEGKTLALTSTPDTIIKLKPQEHCECGGKIMISMEDYTARQVTDIEPMKVITVEYRAQDGYCASCNKAHKAGFPQGVSGTVNYGEHISAMITYLNTFHFLPIKRAAELMEDLFGIKVSQGVIVARGLEAYEKLEGTEMRIIDEILSEPVANTDETGMRVEGSNHWLHSVGTPSCTVYGIHKKRGKAAMDEIGILPKYSGTLVHDQWKSYYHYDKCSHAECNAHHLRQLKYLHEDLGEVWAGEMACLLLRIKKHIDLSMLFGVDRLMQLDIDSYITEYRNILAKGASVQENAAAKRTEAKRMINRLEEYESETLLFMLDFDVPFTNNLAERDLRMPKLKLKVSGGFRTIEGAKAFARVRGFISTTKKKGKNVFDGLVTVFNGDATNFLYPEI